MVYFAVFMTSFSLLAYEIVFVRIFAWAQWVNLSSLIITLALLGFGTSGSVISLFQDRILKRFSCFFSAGLALFPFFLGLGVVISMNLDFNPYELGLDPGQMMGLAVYFFLMGVPFFLGAFVICLGFLKFSVSKICFFNLFGSAVGVLAVFPASWFFHPIRIMMGIMVLACLPAIVLTLFHGAKPARAAVGFLMVLMVVLLGMAASPEMKKVSPYKAISMALTLPGARVIHEVCSPLGVVQVVEAQGLRTTAGLSLVSPFPVPVQKGLFFNAGAMSPVTPFSGDREQIRYLEYLASYLPFYLLAENQKNQVLIMGSGGGESILKAVLSGCRNIHALEVDPNVISLMAGPLARFSGHIYERENVRILNRDARSFIRQAEGRYDLIEISLMDGYNTASSGVSALNENYLYTIESLTEMLAHLTKTGVLAITRWVVTPARDNLKMFNTAVQALQRLGIKDPENHLMAVRSLQTLTLVVSRSPVSPERIEKARWFAQDRLFDLDYFPGIGKSDANRFVKLETPVYYNGMQALLSEDAKAFVRSHTFGIQAATDSRPYFYNFFKPGQITAILRYGPSQIPVTEWGYLILVILLLPVLLIAFVFILVPVLLTGQKGVAMKKTILAYFSLIGAGYFFIEMPLIQKMILFLGHPSYSFPAIIAGLLVFSGAGSLFSDRIFLLQHRMFASCCLVAGITLFYLYFLDNLFFMAMAWSTGLKLVLTLLILAPLGFFMGIPFPCALTRLKQVKGASLPWAFGINGFFSVISILLATLLAVLLGFQGVLILAVLCYAGAGILSFQFNRV